MAQVKKLSVATVFGKIDLKKLIAADEKGETVPVMRVMGSAIGTKTGDSNFGPWTALQGQFKAINLDTGETSEAATLFLPDVALTPILVGLAAPGARGVQFAIDIHAKYAADAKPGGVPYEYTFVPLLPAEDTDPIKQLELRLLALADGNKPASDDKGGDAQPGNDKGGDAPAAGTKGKNKGK